MTDDDLSYAAGFLDGEGCFTVCKNHKITVACENTNRPIIEWLHNNFGGSFTVIRGKKSNHRTTYRWACVSRDALNVCRILAAYLREKSEQALLLIAVQQLKTSGGRIPNENRIERERLTGRCKELKNATW